MKITCTKLEDLLKNEQALTDQTYTSMLGYVGHYSCR